MIHLLRGCSALRSIPGLTWRPLEQHLEQGLLPDSRKCPLRSVFMRPWPFLTFSCTFPDLGHTQSPSPIIIRLNGVEVKTNSPTHCILNVLPAITWVRHFQCTGDAPKVFTGNSGVCKNNFPMQSFRWYSTSFGNAIAVGHTFYMTN